MESTAPQSVITPVEVHEMQTLLQAPDLDRVAGDDQIHPSYGERPEIRLVDPSEVDADMFWRGDRTDPRPQVDSVARMALLQQTPDIGPVVGTQRSRRRLLDASPIGGQLASLGSECTQVVLRTPRGIECDDVCLPRDPMTFDRQAACGKDLFGAPNAPKVSARLASMSILSPGTSPNARYGQPMKTSPLRSEFKGDLALDVDVQRTVSGNVRSRACRVLDVDASISTDERKSPAATIKTPSELTAVVGEEDDRLAPCLRPGDLGFNTRLGDVVAKFNVTPRGLFPPFKSEMPDKGRPAMQQDGASAYPRSSREKRCFDSAMHDPAPAEVDILSRFWRGESPLATPFRSPFSSPGKGSEVSSTHSSPAGKGEDAHKRTPKKARVLLNADPRDLDPEFSLLPADTQMIQDAIEAADAILSSPKRAQVLARIQCVFVRAAGVDASTPLSPQRVGRLAKVARDGAPWFTRGLFGAMRGHAQCSSIPFGGALLTGHAIHHFEHLTQPDEKGGFHLCPTGSPLELQLRDRISNPSTGVYCAAFPLPSGALKVSTFFPPSIASIEELSPILDASILITKNGHKELHTIQVDGHTIYIQLYTRFERPEAPSVKMVISTFPAFDFCDLKIVIESVNIGGLAYKRTDLIAIVHGLSTKPLAFSERVEFLKLGSVIIDIGPELGIPGVPKGVLVEVLRADLARGQLF